tara:strand:+ start:839 stop:1171 length:333 start_codon:yes stop_codon:yes gene_type:complete
VSIRIRVGDSFVNLVSTPSKISIQNPILMVELGNPKGGKVRGMKKIWSFLSEHFPFSGIGLVLFQMSLVNIIVLPEDERWIGKVWLSLVFCLLVYSIWKEYKTYKTKNQS